MKKKVTVKKAVKRKPKSLWIYYPGEGSGFITLTSSKPSKEDLQRNSTTIGDIQYFCAEMFIKYTGINLRPGQKARVRSLIKIYKPSKAK